MSDDESLIDDVTQFEQQVVDLFNARGGDGPDEVAPSSPGDGGEDEAPPESTGGASAPDDLSFIEPADTDDATVDTPVESEQLNVAEPTDGPDDDLLIDQVWGDIPEENLPTARAVYDWYSQLDENAIAQIDATLSGQYVLVPAQQIVRANTSGRTLTLTTNTPTTFPTTLTLTRSTSGSPSWKPKRCRNSRQSSCSRPHP
jgi:hypothetical protein